MRSGDPVRAAPAAQLLPVGTRLGPVHLAVTEAGRAVRFWTRALGLGIVGGGRDEVELGAGGRTLVVLHPGAERPVARGHSGLYHLAVHVPARRDLARAVARLAAARWPQAPTDHVATETSYLSDPDGNGIELTFETPARGTLVALPGGAFGARTPSGEIVPGTAPLDLDDLLGALGPHEPLDEPLPAGTRIGHVHLHVADLAEALAFWRDAIGFRANLELPAIGMADLMLDDSVPHALALNTWAGEGAAPPPRGTAGLLRLTVVTPGPEALDGLVARLRERGVPWDTGPGLVRTWDPSGNVVHVVAA